MDLIRPFLFSYKIAQFVRFFQSSPQRTAFEDPSRPDAVKKHKIDTRFLSFFGHICYNKKQANLYSDRHLHILTAVSVFEEGFENA